MKKNNNEKFKQAENLIDYVLANNFCEQDPKQYIKYLYADLKHLQTLKATATNNEKEFLIDHCIEEIILLQELICLIKEVKE